MGLDGNSPRWLEEAERHFVARLGVDVQAVVVDDPGSDRLIASAAVVVAKRLPTPNNPDGRVGYVQWVATDSDMRRRGLARTVMGMLLGWCTDQGVSIVELHATPDGEPLYRSMGFGQEGGVPLRRRDWDLGG